MLTNDFIVEQGELIIRLLKTVLTGPSNTMIEDVDKILFIGEQKDLQNELRKRLEEYQFNEADDLMYDFLEADDSDDTLCLGLWFYNTLLHMDGDLLEEHDFSKDEALDGLKEVERRAM